MPPKKFFLETLVKDKGIASALKRALADDARLSYEEVLAMIYSACDDNGISPDEIREINAVLDNSKSIRNNSRIMELKRQFRNNPQQFMKYRDFPDEKLFTIIQDVQKAARLSQKCMNSLTMSYWSKPERERLLKATFNVLPNGRDSVNEIQWRFNRCWKVLNGASFQYDSQGTIMAKDHVAAAPHAGRAKKLVYISANYFLAPEVYRLGALIHEMIHHFNGVRSDAHPGGLRTDGRLPLNIPYRQAKYNPYCYQWYAVYLEQPNYTPGINFENELIIKAGK
ncbi:hypothetical protein [Bremerella sp.]|uniref:hypothetical protein n=1 Tax=Bremerella sp. TaxID=2795602 RepID=UPI00391DB3F2